MKKKFYYGNYNAIVECQVKFQLNVLAKVMA